MENKNLAERIRELMWRKLSAESQIQNSVSNKQKDQSDHSSQDNYREKQAIEFREIDRIMKDEDEVRMQLEREMNIFSAKNKECN